MLHNRHAGINNTRKTEAKVQLKYLLRFVLGTVSGSSIDESRSIRSIVGRTLLLIGYHRVNTTISGRDTVCKDNEVSMGFNWVTQWHNIGRNLPLLFLTFSVLFADPKNILYMVANPACGLLKRKKRTTRGSLVTPLSAWRPFIYLNRRTTSGQSRVNRVTQLRTDGVHCPESADTGPVALKVVPVTGAAILQVTMDQLMYAYIFPHPLLV